MIDMTLSPTPYTPTAGRAVLRFAADGTLVVRLSTGADVPVSVDSKYGVQGTSIASAATTDLSTATGEFVDITGTTTISSFGTKPAGSVFTLRFTGIGTITHNATSLILPGGASITRAVGDVMTVRSLGSGNWVCTNYLRASGAALTASGGDFSSNTATSVDGEAVLFSGTGGKTGKRATGTGVAKLASGVLSAGTVNLASEVTGNLPVTNLNGGTGAAATTFWCGNATWASPTVADNAVTLAKLADIATDRLIGRDTAATGDPEVLTVGGGIEFTGSGGVQTSAFTGDVTKTAGGTALTIANDAVTYTKLQNVSAQSRVLGRKTAAAGDTEECTLSEVLDFIGSAAHGDILYRGSSAWARLPAGTSGQFLKTFGAGVNPAWSAAPGWSTLSEQAGQSGNSGAGETTIVTANVPGGSLSANKHAIYYTINGSYAANANTKRVRLKYAGVTIFDMGGADVTTNGGNWQIKGFLAWFSGSVLVHTYHWRATNGTITAPEIGHGNVSATSASSNDFIVTLQASGSGAIFVEHCRVELRNS